jgi:hypothetical protein
MKFIFLKRNSTNLNGSDVWGAEIRGRWFKPTPGQNKTKHLRDLISMQKKAGHGSVLASSQQW